MPAVHCQIRDGALHHRERIFSDRLGRRENAFVSRRLPLYYRNRRPGAEIVTFYQESRWKFRYFFRSIKKSGSIFQPLHPWWPFIRLLLGSHWYNWSGIVPKPTRETVMKENRDAPSAGHLDIAKTSARMSPLLLGWYVPWYRQLRPKMLVKTLQQQQPAGKCNQAQSDARWKP